METVTAATKILLYFIVLFDTTFFLSVVEESFGEIWLWLLRLRPRNYVATNSHNVLIWYSGSEKATGPWGGEGHHVNFIHCTLLSHRTMKSGTNESTLNKNTHSVLPAGRPSLKSVSMFIVLYIWKPSFWITILAFNWCLWCLYWEHPGFRKIFILKQPRKRTESRMYLWENW